MVYIQEAHPTDGWQLETNEEDGVLFAAPASFGERVSIAQSCVIDLGIEFSALVDGLDNAVDRAYTGWPDRLYLIDAEGRVHYKSPPGPFGFESEGLEESLEELYPDLADDDSELSDATDSGEESTGKTTEDSTRDSTGEPTGDPENSDD